MDFETPFIMHNVWAIPACNTTDDRRNIMFLKPFIFPSKAFVEEENNFFGGTDCVLKCSCKG